MARTVLPTPAPGTVISVASWGAKAATATAELQAEVVLRREQVLQVSGAGQTTPDTTAIWDDWFTVGNITVPAGTVSIVAEVFGHVASSVSASQHYTRLRIADTTADNDHNGSMAWVVADRKPIVGLYWFTAPAAIAAGTRQVKMQSYRSAGTGRLVNDGGGGVMSFSFRFYGSLS